MPALESTINSFGGVIIKPEVLPRDPEEFKEQLVLSLKAWKAKGAKVVWLEIPISYANLVPVGVEVGFTFHHAKETYISLTLPLVKSAIIPPYATHYIGVGGVVLNNSKELLVVSERFRRKNSGPSYKLPGGALHPGEHLMQGVVREVLEETGVRTQVEALVCFRHSHEYRFGKSDIYFVCRLSPLNLDISIQEEEIEECLWMPVDDYLNSKDVSLFNRLIVRTAMESRGMIPTNVEGYNESSHEFLMPK